LIFAEESLNSGKKLASLIPKVVVTLFNHSGAFSLST
jgi:hypothetical protein